MTQRKKLERNRIYKLDCFDFLSRLEDTTVDLAIIDPPYNLSKADWDTFGSEKEFLDFTFKWLDALIPKLRNGGSLYVFNTPYNCAYILPHLVQSGLKFQNWITWDKRDGLSGAKQKYSNGQETILFFTKGRDHTFNYDEIRVPYESTERMRHASEKGILKNGKRWFPNSKGKLCGEVWHISSERHKNKVNGKTPKMEHITPKPSELIESIVRASSNRGDLVIDCFVGSGTTAVVAKSLKRNYLCSDSDKNYVELAQRRLKNVDHN
jgi:site-specific DNA-methyltransferase (adenine-specific)